MINLREQIEFTVKTAFLRLLTSFPRWTMVPSMNGLLAICGICREIIS